MFIYKFLMIVGTIPFSVVLLFGILPLLLRVLLESPRVWTRRTGYALWLGLPAALFINAAVAVLRMP